jgi:hypothetical protein
MTIFNQAVENLCGGSHYKLFGSDAYENIVEWFIENPPSKEQVLAEVARLQAEYDAKQYQRDRAKEYPSIQEQMDMQYWDAINGTTTWQDAINAVKTKYPKGA